jgi:hypothetical protein
VTQLLQKQSKTPQPLHAATPCVSDPLHALTNTGYLPVTVLNLHGGSQTDRVANYIINNALEVFILIKTMGFR